MSEEKQYIWTNAQVLAVELPISREAAQAFLPEGLKASDPAMAMVFIAHYPETNFGSVYNEAGILLFVEHEMAEARHCPWMVVDDDTALILGRELLGFPKKMAKLGLEKQADSVVGTVERHGTEIIRIEAKLGGPIETPEPLFERRMVNVVGALPTGLKLVDFPPSGEEFKTCRSAEAKLTLTSSLRDPLDSLQPGPVTKARYMELDFGNVASKEPAIVLSDVDGGWLARHFFARAF